MGELILPERPLAAGGEALPGLGLHLPSSPAEGAPAWYALRIGGNRERKAKAELATMVPEVVCPLVFDRNRARRSSAVTRQRSVLLYLPGFVFIRTVLTAELWHAVHQVRGVTAFAGTVFTRKVVGRIESYVHPARVPESQMGVLLDQMDAEGVIERIAKLPTDLKGQLLRVLDGPFTSFNGECEWHDPERGRLKVALSIFGRAVPVELDETAVEIAK